MIASDIIKQLSKNPDAEVTITISNKKYSVQNVTTMLNEPTIIGVEINENKNDEPFYSINWYLPKDSKTIFNRKPDILHFNFYVTHGWDCPHYYIEVNGDTLFELKSDVIYSFRKQEAINLIRNKYGITDLYPEDFKFIDAFININNGKFITVG